MFGELQFYRFMRPVRELYYFYCQQTTQIQWVKKSSTDLLSHSFHGLEIRHGLTESSLQGLTRVNQSFSQAMFVSEAHDSLPNLGGYWQNSVSCDCRTEVLVFFLSTGFRSQFLENLQNSLPYGPPTTQQLASSRSPGDSPSDFCL